VKIMFSMGDVDSFNMGDSWVLLHHFMVKQGFDMNVQHFNSVELMRPAHQSPDYAAIFSTPDEHVTNKLWEWISTFNMEEEDDEKSFLANMVIDFLFESFSASLGPNNIETFVMGHKPEGDIIGPPETGGITYATVIIVDTDEQAIDYLISNNTLADLKKQAGVE